MAPGSLKGRLTLGLDDATVHGFNFGQFPFGQFPLILVNSHFVNSNFVDFTSSTPTVLEKVCINQNGGELN